MPHKPKNDPPELMSREATVRAIKRFNWKNDHWADWILPHIRVAAFFVEYDGQGDPSFIVNDWGEGWREAREHLLSVIAILDDALARAERGGRPN